ncbi:ABC transporter permease [Paracoccus aminophilus]|uniref:Spermidine/putrescine transport system, permease protein n=1 Tax=Paracoccus aminophilus JCM 7686 TaxID=1367847 RepID=S5XR27_PARAH|nr:spermidine/putrescine transport system, permease protein [Paracoccus aminophilus]AGT09859.1 spermidine/putrescine transport system, permease protein [Paracoccus aminophilus JCM 7686]
MSLRTTLRNWAGLLPFLAFALAFELAPIGVLMRSAFTVEGSLGLGNFSRALTPVMQQAFVNSLGLALASALLGTALGLIVARAITTSRSATTQNMLTALADVTANFGGAPLAFAFVITLGSTGIITLLLKQVGIDLYPAFRIYSLSGLVIAYTYFQLPLAILLMIPALLGLRREWSEAATSLGATGRDYWLRVALPILRPSLLGCFFLLFANAFGAYATAWTLTGSAVNLVTVQIAALARGEVQFDPALADALATLSLAVMLVAVGLCQMMMRRRA